MTTDALTQKPVDGSSPIRQETAETRADQATRMTQELYPCDALFSPVQVNGLTLKNRIAMAPMSNLGMGGESGRPGDAMLEYYFARAKGGAGLLITGPVPVGGDEDGLSSLPRINRSRTVFSGWRDLATGVHAHGARIFILLTARPGGAEALHPPAPNEADTRHSPSTRRRSADRKREVLLAAIGQAAADARAMGLDGVCLREHGGPLPAQEDAPARKRRGRNQSADPAPFGVDAVREIRRRAGPDFPILYHIGLPLTPEESDAEATGNQVFWANKMKPGGEVAGMPAHMEQLVAAGVDAFEIGVYRDGDAWLHIPPADMPGGCFLEAARAVRAHFAQKSMLSNAGLPVLVAGAGRLGHPDIAEGALREGDCDLVMLGRPLLADPDWPGKVFAGQAAAIRPCIGCGTGCLQEPLAGGHLQCAVNPRAGFEALLPEAPAPAVKKKKIAVVGAGPGGVTAAVTAARRGHSVTLYEKTDAIGGGLVAGAVPRAKFDIENYRLYLERLVRNACKRYGLHWRPATEVTAEFLREEKYEAVLFATGAQDAPPPDGLCRGFVRPAELLLTPDKLDGVQSILVAGGGAAGCETARWLALEQGRRVTVVERLPRFMEGVCAPGRGHLLRTLQKAGVQLLGSAELVAFGAGRATIRRYTPEDTSKNHPADPADQRGGAFIEESLAADLVVLATGSSPGDALYFAAQEIAAAPELYSLGGSFEAGGVLEAVRAAYRLGAMV